MSVKENKIREVMKALDSGLYIKIVGSHGITGTLWERMGRGGYPIIFWNHFGESANRRTLKDLTWIINTIFDKKYKDFDYRIVKNYWDE